MPFETHCGECEDGADDGHALQVVEESAWGLPECPRVSYVFGELKRKTEHHAPFFCSIHIHWFNTRGLKEGNGSLCKSVAIEISRLNIQTSLDAGQCDFLVNYLTTYPLNLTRSRAFSSSRDSARLF